MCYGYGNCGFESYPNGPNEGCHCRLPWWAICPMDAEMDAKEDGDQYDPDDDYDEARADDERHGLLE